MYLFVSNNIEVKRPLFGLLKSKPKSLRIEFAKNISSENHIQELRKYNKKITRKYKLPEEVILRRVTKHKININYVTTATKS